MRLFPILVAAGAVANSWKSSSLQNLRGPHNVITFGDSYTDEGRLSAYFSNNGQPPPPGTSTAGSNFTASGGYAWGYFATQKLGAKYYDYAVSGAYCSNEIFSRYLAGINRTYPSVLEDEIPSFVQEAGNKTFYPNREADNSIYAIWIGTNDLGNDAFLVDSQKPGLTITNFVECIWEVFDIIHKNGGRHFVILNEAPLELSPLYAAQQNFGVSDNHYWTNKASYNMTEYEQKIKEYTTNVNTMFHYGVPFQNVVQKRWHGSSFTVFDVHSLITDIYNEPEKYLDAPFNSTGFYRECNEDGSVCTNSENPLSSFLWYDELHPSEKTDEIIGNEFAKLVKGKSKYAIYW
ncbi:acetyl esterase [Pseudomassariella vexata]|uniref:Acetyl esterase n=1 Tax=Pseudomassariella vexata TaxID=1141098 RepID=A0A1Y2E7K2_9PEZI|nr:acetyl esterase [Pseudomassariella vexata]ORY67520.1 acetyl esterase [Pseudomassariella vexata]